MNSLCFKLGRQFASAPLKRKTTQLKELLHSPNLNFIMEAHNGLSAAIVEEAGFKGIFFFSIKEKKLIIEIIIKHCY